MGVRGLCKFVDENSRLTSEYKLHDTRVVIDGANLVHFLYQTKGIDDMFGGDYSEFAIAIEEYFSAYRECNIEPVVIFDGGLDKSDRMFKKLEERQKNRLQKVKQLIETEECGESILPIIAFEVFKSKLSEIGIKVAQCDYEGDNQMAALANDYNCPVLSDDSDFYIFDVHGGFVRLSSVVTEVQIEKSGCIISFKYLYCKMYSINTLLSHYHLKNKSVLPLFSTLAGNDYACYEDFKQFYYRIKVRSKDRIPGILNWLRSFTLDQAIDEVLNLTQENKVEDIESLIENSMEDYEIKPTNLVQILRAGTLHLRSELVLNTKMVTPCGTQLRPKFVIDFHTGLLSSTLLNIITLQRQFLSPQVEDLSLLGSYTCSRYVRQVIYGILLQHKTKSFHRHNKKCLRNVNEYDPQNGEVRLVSVKFITVLKNGERVPKLTNIYNMEKEYLRDFIAMVMDAEKSFFLGIPSHLQLFLGCVNYWLLNSSPKPLEEFVSAVLLCLVYYQLQKESPLVKDRENVRSIESSILTALGSNIQCVIERMGYFLIKPILDRENPLNLKIIHCYSQLQTCVLSFIQLNTLADLPFELPKLQEILNGTMLYNLTKYLLLSSKPDIAVKKVLGSEFKIIELFNMLKSKVLEHVPCDYFTKTKFHRPKNRY